MAGYTDPNPTKEEVEELKRFNRKSAAIETVFTLAVIWVSALQVLIPQTDIPSIWLAFPAIVLVGLALLIGGKNLGNQLWASLSLS